MFAMLLAMYTLRDAADADASYAACYCYATLPLFKDYAAAFAAPYFYAVTVTRAYADYAAMPLPPRCCHATFAARLRYRHAAAAIGFA